MSHHQSQQKMNRKNSTFLYPLISCEMKFDFAFFQVPKNGNRLKKGINFKMMPNDVFSFVKKKVNKQTLKFMHLFDNILNYKELQFVLLFNPRRI
jgi:hypothetical protein